MSLKVTQHVPVRSRRRQIFKEVLLITLKSCFKIEGSFIMKKKKEIFNGE
jgi:hypothetical protein